MRVDRLEFETTLSSCGAGTDKRTSACEAGPEVNEGVGIEGENAFASAFSEEGNGDNSSSSEEESITPRSSSDPRFRARRSCCERVNI